MGKSQDITVKDKPFDRLKKWWKTYVGLEDYIALVLMTAGIICYIFPPDPDLNNFTAFLFDFRAELLGAGIATLLIGNASQAAQIKEEKKRLILQMGSPDNGFAVEAARQLRQHGWLQDGSLIGAYLFEANLNGAKLRYANLSGVTLWRAKLSGAKLNDANLSEARMAATNLSQANFQSANLSGADLEEANLIRAILWGSNLRGANLQSANLSGAILWDVNLSRANLQLTDLSGTKFCDQCMNTSARFDENTIWEDAFYTKGENGTVFPEGFNPADHRMHLIRDDESFKEAYKRVFPDDNNFHEIQ